MPDQTQVTDEQMAWNDLGLFQLATCLERQNVLPFSLLSDDGFEVCCFILLLRENPCERIYYYGKTGDKGRDIVRHRLDGTVEFIQCKRYTDNVGVGEVRKELAKLCVNVFGNHLPVKPDRVTFYIVPDLSSGAQDLLVSQDEWRDAAPTALKEHLGKKPTADLLSFAQTWWPTFEWVTAAALGVRVEMQPTLLDRFFAVKKVIEGSAADLQDLREQVRALKTGLADIPQSVVSALGVADGIQPPLTKAQEVIAKGREKTWEERARRSLDAQGQQLWEEIRTEIRGLNNIAALDRGQVMKAWLLGDGAYASAAMRGKVCVLLADLAVIESAIVSLHERIDTTEARTWQSRAVEELGDVPSPEDASRLVYLDARLTWLEGRPADAMIELDATEDPNCASLKLSILICEGRDVEAVEAARKLPLDDRWCDRMVLAYAQNGLPNDATTVYAWAQARPDSAVYHRCLIANAQGTMQRLFVDRDRRALFLEPLPSDDGRVLRELLNDLKPLFASAVSRTHAAQGVETEALELAFMISRFLGEGSLWQQYGGLLAKGSPPSLEFARAVCRGELESSPDLSTRIRAEYPRSFTAGHVAAVLDAFDGYPFSGVAKSADSLIPLAETVEQREEIAGLLLELALGEEGAGALDQARTTGIRLLGADHALVRLAECEVLRRTGKIQEADTLLASCHDETDLVWLQMAAAAAKRSGDTKATLGYFLKAARLLGRRETYWQAFTLAHQAHDTVAAREMMEVLSRLTPEDPNVHRNLAAIDFQAGRFRDAVSWLQRVESLTPDAADIGLFLGQSLALAGRGDEAVKVLDRVCTAHPAAFNAHHLRAMILDSLGKPVLAFEGLHVVRERFWGEMAFVQVYHTLSYKVNREQQAHLAFLRLQELQAGNTDGPLRIGTLDELRELMRKERERHEHLNSQLLSGKLPWPMVGHALRREAYLDWAIRTQKVFVPDAPPARAEYAVYATNAFTVYTDQQPQLSTTLEPITAGPPAQPVVADLSALLTLHRLGLLDQAISYFGRIILPAGYAALFLEENRSLQPHQLSQNEARQAILTAVDQGRLRPLSPTGQSEDSFPLLDEHHLDEEGVDFHLIDAVMWLQQSGRLTPDETNRIQSVSHRPAVAATGSAFRMAASRGLRMRVSTLTTVHTVDLLDRFLSSMRLFLAQDEIEKLRREQLGEARREELNRWTRELRDFLSSDCRVETAEPTLPDAVETHSNPDRDLDPALDALLLADQRKLSLLADDRCLQALVLNSRHGCAGAAFGTDTLLAALADEGQISEEERATAWLQLVRWRYRFLIPPSEILVALAGRHASFPPGEELREVSRYLHDCCLDPGLFCGMEPVQPPASIGWRFFQSIVQSIGHFLMRAWHDSRFDETTLLTLTRWAASELVPPPPRQLPYAGYAIACESVPRIVFASAFADIAHLRKNIQRSNVALVAIAEAFGLSADEYDETVALLVDSTIDFFDEPEALVANTSVRRLMALTAMRHRQKIGIRTASTLADLGLLASLEDPVEVSDLAALSDPVHQRRISLPDGPWVFLRGLSATEYNTAHYVPDFLFHQKQPVRQAAIGHLSAPTSTSEIWLTPGSRQLVASVAEDICGEDTRRSRAAARALDALLSKDLLMALAIFRQTRASQMQEANNDALQALLEPRSGMLHSVPSAWYCLPGAEWDEVRHAVAREPEITTALDRYYERFGHLPLASSYAVESAVRAWIDMHGNEGVWDAVHAWANDDSRPLKRYHAGRIFFALPSLVSEGARPGVWLWVTEFLEGLDDPPERPSLRGQTWLFLHSLARHYLQLLEVESHEEDSTALAALAWWTAERVVQLLVSSAVAEYGPEQAVGIVQRMVLRGVVPLAGSSMIGWVLGRLTRSPSALAHGTLHFNSLWQLSLLESGPEVGLTMPEEQVQPISLLFTLAFATGFPARLVGMPSPRIAVETALTPLAVRWASAMSEFLPLDGEILHQKDASPPDTAESVEQVRTIWEWEEDTRLLPLQRFHNAIGLGGVTPQDMRWILDDRLWWDQIFERLTREQLESLYLSLFELMRKGGEDWQLKLPHLFLRQALRGEVSVENRSVSAHAVVQAAIISGNRGSLVALVEEAVTAELLACFTVWRRRLNDIRPVVPPPVQAMIRTVLAVLPATESGLSSSQGGDTAKK